VDERARFGTARWWRAAMIALMVAAVGCGGGDGTPDASTATATSTPTATASVPVRSPTPVIVDTDLAIDDLVALALLLSSDDIDVLAVTVSGTGEVRCPAGVGVVRELLMRTGDEDVPVACGRSTPLVGTHEFPVEWRDAADSGWGVLVPIDQPEPDPTSAVELLGETLQPGVTLLTLGPLTNVAEALRADVGLADRVASIVVMGGAIDVTGNVLDPALDAVHSEWNLYVDPTAAFEVFGSGAPVLLVALDATNQVPVTPVFIERLALNSHTAPASLVASLYDANPLVGSGDAYFWDPLAAAAVIDRGVLTTERADIAIVTDEGPESGRTIRSETGSPIDVATDADGVMLEDLLLRTLDGLSPEEALVEPPPPVGEAVVTYDGTNCTYDGPTTVPAGRIGFRFDSTDPTWVAAVAHLTGDLTIDEIVTWIEANPTAQEPPPGVGDVAVAPPGVVTFVNVQAPEVAVVCSPFEPGPLLIAGSIVVD
ncbi:MAG TPA: nucleoside hydrolase, partial [Ilumatobacteraceae bacterium]|nr:nucleoside hydrolase [Ilumatobacteraceae bacterium]